MFSPEPDNPQTWFAAWVTQLDESVVAEDLEDLRPGVDEGLSQLPGSQVESASQDVFGNLIRFDRIFTFQENGATRKRRLWILYVDKWLIVLTWQGSSPEEYQYWISMANYIFGTFNIPDALWFATDRDLMATLRSKSGGA